jgi:hypothetical protein
MMPPLCMPSIAVALKLRDESSPLPWLGRASANFHSATPFASGLGLPLTLSLRLP